jgi:hypothetical protein
MFRSQSRTLTADNNRPARKGLVMVKHVLVLFVGGFIKGIIKGLLSKRSA